MIFVEEDLNMMSEQEITVVGAKNCLLCGKQVRGRVDKKFCDDYCRNSFNNKLKGLSSNMVRNINNALGKNRRILENLLSEVENGSAKTNKEKLVQMGFQFKYLTHVHKTKAGKHYHYCYDYGYLPLENDWFQIVKLKEN
jgi:predicted nucleic acid-binding Zn ribbon protein